MRKKNSDSYNSICYKLIDQILERIIKEKKNIWRIKMKIENDSHKTAHPTKYRYTDTHRKEDTEVKAC